MKGSGALYLCEGGTCTAMWPVVFLEWALWGDQQQRKCVQLHKHTHALSAWFSLHGTDLPVVSTFQKRARH